MLAFDSADVAAADRARTVIAGLGGEGIRLRVTLLCAEASLRARWWCLPLSPAAGVYRYEGSALRMTRRAADVAAQPTDRLTFAVPGSPGSTLWQDGRLRPLHADDLVLIDDATPFDYRGGEGSLCAVHVSRVALGVSAEQTHAAASHLRDSPLHDLARDHVRALGRIAAAAGGRSLGDVGRATALLFSALLLSCDVF
ncbi:hypothetical protein [Cryptosporangium arvum]|uniref:hypothetical protein n=1 Tax=Cryptosporangium arvum TaxID=80871 RepID=UPI0012ECC7CB|nr:hypothetical protein [Cryptosporangium arvum]